MQRGSEKVDLTGMKKLKKLVVKSTPLTDAAIPMIIQLASLTELEISFTQISEAGIKQIQAALPKCKITE